MTTPYDSAESDLLEEIISQGERRLQAQLELGKAADQRAMTFAGILLAAVALLAGLAFGEHPLQEQQLAFVCLGLGLLISSSLALWSARPIAWEIAGNTPESYDEDIAANRKLSETRPETAMHLQEMIGNNHEKLRWNGNWMKASMMIALVSAAAGIISALVE
jgi:hypothetical protein